MEDENQFFEAEVINDDDVDDVIEELKNKRNNYHDIKTSDIITMQCILCIILAIMLIVINITLPKISNQIIEKYKSESSMERDINDTLVAIVSKISDFVNSTPNDRA